MVPLWSWEIPFIQWLQQGHPLLTPLFRAITELGSVALVILLPLLYWSIRKEWGIQLLLTLGLSQALTLGLKAAFELPRPFQYSPEILQLAPGRGYGFPSGHTVNGVVVWFYLGRALRRRGSLLAGLLLASLVGLSRIYLGVHWPVDVVGGALIGTLGLIILLAWISREPRERKRRLLGLQIPGVLAAGLFALQVAPEDRSFVSTAAAVTWGIVGLLLEETFLRFDTAGTWQERLLRVLLGAGGGGLIWLAAQTLFTALGAGGPLATGLLLAPVILWFTWGAPALFVTVGLAGRMEG
jgi:membrane-associated phospholipid phosphatase